MEKHMQNNIILTKKLKKLYILLVKGLMNLHVIYLFQKQAKCLRMK